MRFGAIWTRQLWRDGGWSVEVWEDGRCVRESMMPHGYKPKVRDHYEAVQSLLEQRRANERAEYH